MGETIYVAVNQLVRESKANLLWTLGNFQVRKLVLLHIHAQFSLTTSSCELEQGVIDAVKESEVNNLYSSLRKYRIICTDKGVNEEDVDTLCISGYDVGEEIVNLIHQNKIKKLVMGAAANTHYSRGMSIKSRKATYVSEHAPRGCKMWFICKGKLITTKQGSVDLGNSPHPPPTQKPNPRRDDITPSPPPAYMCPITLVRIQTQHPELYVLDSNACFHKARFPLINYMMYEIMRDPHLAADGYTYEAAAFRNHIRIVSKNSPMTNLPLDHCNLTPNRILATMIKEWLEKHPNYED